MGLIEDIVRAVARPLGWIAAGLRAGVGLAVRIVVGAVRFAIRIAWWIGTAVIEHPLAAAALVVSVYTAYHWWRMANLVETVATSLWSAKAYLVSPYIVPGYLGPAEAAAVVAAGSAARQAAARAYLNTWLWYVF